MNYKRNRGRRGRPEGDRFDRNQRRRDSPGNSQDRQRRFPKHPPHLRGREIGLYYARRKWLEKNTTTDDKGNIKLPQPKPIGRVVLSETRQNFIESSLKNMDLIGKMFITDDGSYDHVSESSFKRNFLRTIHGNIDDNLKALPPMERYPDIDERLYEDLKSRKSDSAYNYMFEARKKLPSFDKKDDILKIIEENQVVVISGETGCGKTTQVSQFILDDYIMKKKGSLCRIVCTQPRRISAVSVAERVSEERAERLGKSVGYQIRLEKEPPRDRGSIIFCTTGVVLKWMESDACLTNVSHLIIDEIHERNVMSDFIIALMKKLIVHRRDLKLILMSATLNAEKFSNYFDGCPHINIPGFTYPVEEYYLEDVLQLTGFEFSGTKEFLLGNKNNLKGKKRKKKNVTEKEKEWNDFIEPYIRNIEAKKQYSRHVCDQLRNPQSEKTNVDLILSLLIHICRDDQTLGAILIFLTGLSEISALIKLMEGSRKFPPNRFIIVPLHSLLSTVDQKKIFDRPPPGVRKIVVATNIAETSITIDDVVFVIDCGKIKMSNYNVQTDTQTLLPEWVSLANANQRKGRAGRTQPGVCFHLYTKIRRITLDDFQQPEVLRKRLEDTILTLKMLKLGKAEPFLQSLMDSPDPKAVESSIRLLVRLNALDNDEKLTPLGYHLARLPMAPQMGKMILMGAIFSCLDPILSIAATLDFKDGFVAQLGKERELDKKKLELTNGVKNDHLVFIEALRKYESSPYKRRFCYDNYLSWNTMRLLCNMKQQFMEYLHEMNFVASADPKSPECNVNSENTSLIQAVVCSGLYPNVAIMRKKKSSRYRYSLRTMEDDTSVKFHPKSIMSMCESEYIGTNAVVYHLKLKSSQTFLHDASVVNPLSLLFFGDAYVQNEEDDKCTVGVGTNINFLTNTGTAAIIKELRSRLNWFLEYKAANPGPVSWGKDDGDSKLLQAIMELITSEDKGELSDSEDDCLLVDDDVNVGANGSRDVIDLDNIKHEVDDHSDLEDIVKAEDFIVLDEYYSDGDDDDVVEIPEEEPMSVDISNGGDGNGNDVQKNESVPQVKGDSDLIDIKDEEVGIEVKNDPGLVEIKCDEGGIEGNNNT